MGQRTSYEPGTFSWVDLATSDPDGAKAFYGELFGWETVDYPAGDAGTYTMCRLGDDNVAALFRQGDDPPGVPPHWNSYVTVGDVAAGAERARELGGNVLAEPFDVMDAGRMAVIQDPTGAALCLWEPRENPGAARVNEPGCLTWNDLYTNDPPAAREFYGALFGWSIEQVDTGGGPGYSILRVGERTNGGIMELQQPGVPSHWIPYFAVDSTDDAVERAKAAGATLHAGPIAVPAGRFAVFADPQGAAFAVVDGEFDP